LTAGIDSVLNSFDVKQPAIKKQRNKKPVMTHKKLGVTGLAIY
jgi:hypothetical protein